MNISILDLSAFNCWIVYILPYNDPEDNKKLQAYCIEEKMFGIGWGFDAPGYNLNDELTESGAEDYVKAWKDEKKDGSPRVALSNMLKIKENDYIIMRQLDGRFYIGRVKKERGKICYYTHSPTKGEPLYGISWGCSVQEWRRTESEEDVPSEIRGRFSQSFHSTIQGVSSYSYRLKILIAAMYDRTKQNKTDMPEIIYTEQNFARSMHYMQLEDLVYLYIRHEIDKDYLFVPSSGKVNRINYEFSWVKGKKQYITCQVKNQEAIDEDRIDIFANDKAYEKIYVYSGKWNQERSEELKKYCEDKGYKRVRIISRKELFDFLEKLVGTEELLFNDDYCHIRRGSEGYPSVDDVQSKCEGIKGLKLTKDEDGILHFNAKWNLIYAPEVGRILQINPDDDNGKIAKTKELLQQALKNDG